MKDVRLVTWCNEAFARADPGDPICGSEAGKTGAMRAVMKNQIDISTMVDAVYETVLYLTGDAHQARWDAYWTLTTLMYPEMEEAA